jgi:hypothetical protein
MSLKFLSNNLIDSATLTASTENAQYPVSNINDPRRTKTFRSTSNSDNIVIDFGSAEEIDHFAIVDNWQNGFGVTSITIEGNGTDSWGAPAFSTTATLDTTFGVSIKAFASAQTYRFWRIVLTSTLGYCEIANMFLGKATQITTNGLAYGWQYRNNDLSRKSSNRYGQRFVDDIGTQKFLSNLQFQVMDKDEIDLVLSVYDRNREVKPFFVALPLESDSLFNNDDRFNGFYYFNAEPRVNNINSGYYNTTLNLIEAK